jgi:hypothetical protein
MGTARDRCGLARSPRTPAPPLCTLAAAPRLRRLAAAAAYAGALAVGALNLAACRPGTPAYDPAEIADAESPRDLVAMAAEVREQVERLSGLELRAPLRMRWQSRADARRFVEQRLAEELPPERLEGIRLVYVTLGVVPDTLDLHALLLDLYTEQVLGYYDPRTETLFLVEGESAAELRPVLIHELVHALQDQHTDIEPLVAFERGADRQAAAHAALEGHAMVVMFTALQEDAARRRLDPAALPNPAAELGLALEEQHEQFPVFRRAPRIVRETLLFPYVHGTTFVWQLWRSQVGQERYPAPLGELLPSSTSQVMHPVERFIRGRAEPVELRFADPPADRQVLYENTFGELETAIILAHDAGDDQRTAARGWAGDRYRLTRDATGALVLEWTSAWRDAAAADRFAAAADRALGGRPGRSVHVTREDFAGFPGVRLIDAPAVMPGADIVPTPVRVVDAAEVARLLRTDPVEPSR